MENWEYGQSLVLPRVGIVTDFYIDITNSEFPGIYSMSDGKGYAGPRPNTDSHPHFNLDKTMTPIPHVSPGDMVFWHSVSDIIRHQAMSLTKAFF